MSDRYRLCKPIFGVQDQQGETHVITIPAGSKVQAFIPAGHGLVDVVWNEQTFRVFAMDLLDCGELVGQLPQ